MSLLTHEKILLGVGVTVVIIQGIIAWATMYTVMETVEELTKDKYYRTEAMLYQNNIDKEIELLKADVQLILSSNPEIVHNESNE